MALAATWFEASEDVDTQGDVHARWWREEGTALRWLETLPPPAIDASKAMCRSIVTSYVPVNDHGGGQKNSPKTELDKLRNKGLAVVPEHRLQQSRGFPVAIPHDPTVYLVWRRAELDDHHAALERLAAKVTHVGHSASFTQMWVERDCDIAAKWELTDGIATHHLRVPSAGRLGQLVRPYQEAWTIYREIQQAETDLNAMIPPPRMSWRRGFPDAVLLADETQTKRHPAYATAKAGDDSAAATLVDALVSGSGIGAVGLTGKPYSAKLKPSQEQLHELGEKHGRNFEQWWKRHFGHAFDCLTQSEARYLARSPDVDTIRDRLAKAERQRDRPSHARSLKEQKQYINELRDQKSVPPLRPVPGKWQGYTPRLQKVSSEPVPQSIFGPHLVVLGIGGRRVSLPATLKLTAALRGLLMAKCPGQSPREWFSGHGPDGKPTLTPHLALAPLPFVGSQHADGRIMELALVLPNELDAREARHCLEPIIRDHRTGLPREHRLFSGDWLDCAVELETSESRPTNLDPATWTTPFRVWASVTPVVLNRHFDGSDKWERAAESVKDMCGHVGLPRPHEVLLHPVSLVEGVPHAREFPRLTRKRDRGRQSHSHTVVIFDEPVRGPVLIGAGRYRGYGLCRPMTRDYGKAKRW